MEYDRAWGSSSLTAVKRATADVGASVNERNLAMSLQPNPPSGNGAATDFGAIVIGAGYGGLRMLYELRERGISAQGIEAGSDVGGTWYWNRYPGARTDSEAWVYCFPFSKELLQEWDWSERFPAQPEV